MYVKAERNRGVAEFLDSVHGVKVPGHSYVDHPLSERANVGYDVDVAGAGVCCPVVDVFDGLRDVDELVAQTLRALDVAVPSSAVKASV